MIKNIFFILSGIVCATLFVFIKNKVVNKTKEIVGEKFSLPKFLSGLTNVTSSTSWAKTISTLFNARTLIIISVFLGVYGGYMYLKGKQSTPVNFQISFDEEINIPVPKDTIAFQKPKFSSKAYWLKENGTKQTMIIKDVPSLAKALRPYGFRLRPFFTAGGSLGEKKSGGDFGVGIDFLKWYRSNANVFITNQGGYVGVGYQITQNFDILLGAGKGYMGDNRAYIGGKWKF